VGGGGALGGVVLGAGRSMAPPRAHGPPGPASLQRRRLLAQNWQGGAITICCHAAGASLLPLLRRCWRRRRAAWGAAPRAAAAPESKRALPPPPRYYSIFTLFMLVAFECTVVSQRVRNLKELRSLTTPKMALNVYRSGK
jgi:hypothetical protein